MDSMRSEVTSFIIVMSNSIYCSGLRECLNSHFLLVVCCFTQKILRFVGFVPDGKRKGEKDEDEVLWESF